MNPYYRSAAALGAAFLFSHVGMRVFAPVLETRAGLVVLLAIDVAALTLGAWAARSASLAALVGCAVVAPVLLGVRVPEAGGWWHLIAIYKFALLTVFGWWGWFRASRSVPSRGALSWAGAVVPSLCAAGVVCLMLFPV